MADKATVMMLPTDTIECPLCGEGRLRRTEILDRLGVRDFARVAQLSAEEAFRLVLEKTKDDQQRVWLRFESELAKRTADLRDRNKDELHAVRSQKDDLVRRVEDCLREVAQLRERNQELEGELSKTVRRGKLEEISFEEEVRTWAGLHVTEKLAKNGDYVLSYRDPSGSPIEPRMLVDNKDKSTIAEADITKLVRDAKERNTPVAILVAREESQLRQSDRECRWAQKDKVWVLRTTRLWLPRDLDVLRPVLARLGRDGADFLDRNAALAEEVRRSLVDLDEIEKELKKAAKAITSASGLVIQHKDRMKELCDNAMREQ